MKNILELCGFGLIILIGGLLSLGKFRGRLGVYAIFFTLGGLGISYSHPHFHSSPHIHTPPASYSHSNTKARADGRTCHLWLP
jgi:hypothetical protein